ncbi:hypothetical protein Bca52824_041251 [Brassica carinata]|uniref:Uncharacterized protein n=1 Tax=Brassica carinata TaxID=52824 RepID=A0A8X7RV02_BRACI|nr:hypothetical protein Bca52824_041251 [Brassica carinata]
MNLIIAFAATVHRLHGYSGQCFAICISRAFENKEKIACFTADQPRQQKKHKSQSTVSDANAGVDPERIFSQFH